MLPPPGIEVVLLALVLGAAVYDVRYRRIPNWLTVSGAAVGVALNTFLGFGWSGLRFSLVGLLVAFGVYLVLYVLHAMGAGDVKLMAAVGSMVGWANWVGIFIITALLGGVMALILVVAKHRLQKTIFNVGFILAEMKQGRPAYLSREELDVKSPKSVGLPHGAVIAIGSLFFLAFGVLASR
ncbi:MAG TPA: A24 family peptidase [Bryobacteraceae bacterium]|nr:A24 family peptidase [Bryobacteraceae bacterium]